MSTPAAPTSYNFAEIWEYVAAVAADREALVCGDRRLTFAQLEARANRVAHHLRAAGVGPGDPVGIFSANCTEWIEALLAGWKLRALPFNINFRYGTNELAELLDDSQAVALVYDRALTPVVEALDPEIRARLRTTLAITVDEDAASVPLPEGVRAFDEAVDSQPDDAPVVEGRDGDDGYLLYTGGTTGRPKGVLWRQEDAFFACFGGGDPMRNGVVQSPAEIADRVSDFQVCFLCLPPLMHAAGQWVGMSWLWAGSRVVLSSGSFDAARTWDLVDAEGVNIMTFVGDATGKPLLDAWEAEPERWSAASLFVLSNGAAPMSPTLKQRVVATFPNLPLVDGFGSSETGAQGSQRLEPGQDTTPGAEPGVARFSPYGDGTRVLGDDLQAIEPGSDEIGRVALSGHIPVGYLNDPERTAETFVEVDGRRWVLTGDIATVAVDGTISLLGRGSQCINTGGEKVYSEEVEGALHGHPDVEDVLVVGIDDDRWGQSVCAVVQPRTGATLTLEDLRAHCRATLAGYKLPKALVLVDEVARNPAGKADYRWAREVAEGHTTSAG